jgi:hypothetical protein
VLAGRPGERYALRLPGRTERCEAAAKRRWWENVNLRDETTRSSRPRACSASPPGPWQHEESARGGFATPVRPDSRSRWRPRTSAGARRHARLRKGSSRGRAARAVQTAT